MLRREFYSRGLYMATKFIPQFLESPSVYLEELIRR